jgi:murein DD-endopeptidase MepM/ murein hydrolase activator NlpD
MGRSVLLAAAIAVMVSCAAPAAQERAPEPVVATSRPQVVAPVSSSTRTAQPTPTPTARPRTVVEQAFVPFAEVGGVTLHHPAKRVERVGFHQSNHEGARELEVRGSAVRAHLLKSRERLTSSRTAADIVVDPDAEIRAPVTGMVKRAGGYVLYCRYNDDYAVIEPDGHPGWEVKLLHIDGVQVRPGQRVTAGETVMAPRATKLPFKSQVDKITAKPAWPHVHVEVVDPTIPNVVSPGSEC